jgi:hypothetical protein
LLVGRPRWCVVLAGMLSLLVGCPCWWVVLAGGSSWLVGRHRWLVVLAGVSSWLVCCSRWSVVFAVSARPHPRKWFLKFKQRVLAYIFTNTQDTREKLKLHRRNKNGNYRRVAGRLCRWVVLAGWLSSLMGRPRWCVVLAGRSSSLVGCPRWMVILAGSLSSLCLVVLAGMLSSLFRLALILGNGF